MTYKDLLVHLDDSKSCAKRVDAAVRLARQHGAHLTGVYPIVEISLCTTSGGTFLETSGRPWMPRRKGRPRPPSRAFGRLQSGGVAYETRTDHALDSTIASVLSMHTRYADLVVLGQADPMSHLRRPLSARAGGALVRAAGPDRAAPLANRHSRRAGSHRVGCEPGGCAR